MQPILFKISEKAGFSIISKCICIPLIGVVLSSLDIWDICILGILAFLCRAFISAVLAIFAGAVIFTKFYSECLLLIFI